MSLKKILFNLEDFFNIGLWQARLERLPRLKAFGYRLLRISVLSYRRFREEHSALRVLALTFYSLLSIVPVMAMVFGVAQGFGMEAVLEKQLMANMKGQEQVVAQIIDFAHKMLENTKGGLVAGVGVLLLFWTVVKVLSHIEIAFNSIWNVKKPRDISRKLSDYLMFMLVCPVLFVMSSSAAVVVGTHVESFIRFIGLSGAWSVWVMAALNYLPYVVIWFLFSFVYKFMPNTEVKPLSALFAGIVAGTIYQLLQFIYIRFQVGVASYNAVYGSFAALPLFLVWLQMSWSILLMGSHISYACQHISDYQGYHHVDELDAFSRRNLSLCTAYLVIKNFEAGKKPLLADDISSVFGLSTRLIRVILCELAQVGILIEAREGYQPARDIYSIRVKDVIDSVDRYGAAIPLSVDNSVVSKVKQRLDAIAAAAENAGATGLLKDI